jgi:hypothetical protein
MVNLERQAHALRPGPGASMKCLMNSWLRSSNRSASVTLPSGASKTYSFSILTYSSARRSAANRTRNRVSSFSLMSSSFRAAFRSSRDTTLWPVIVGSIVFMVSSSLFVALRSIKSTFGRGQNGHSNCEIRNIAPARLACRLHNGFASANNESATNWAAPLGERAQLRDIYARIGVSESSDTPI